MKVPFYILYFVYSHIKNKYRQREKDRDRLKIAESALASVCRK